MRHGAGTAPGGSGRAYSKPPSRWWIPAVAVPCLLAGAVSAVVVLQNFAAAVGNCFDTCEPTSYVHRLQTVTEVEFFVGIAAVVTVLIAAGKPSWRPVLAGVGGVLCLLAFLGLHAG
jgi:hypothetical protein